MINKNTLKKALIQINDYLGTVARITKLNSLSNNSFLITYKPINSPLQIKKVILKLVPPHNPVTKLISNSVEINNDIISFIYSNQVLAGNNFKVFRYIPGHILKGQDFKNTKILTNLLKSIKSMYQIPFNPKEEIKITDTTRLLLSTLDNSSIILRLHRTLDILQENLSTLPTNLAFCHNDLMKANIIVNINTVHLIDFEYSCVSDIFFDLHALKSMVPSKIYIKIINFYQENFTPNLTKQIFEKKLDLYSQLSPLIGVVWALYMEKYSNKPKFYYRLLQKYYKKLNLLHDNNNK